MQALYFLLHTVLGLYCGVVLLRVYMQYCRISFVGDLGNFVCTLTNWVIRPMNSIIPTWRGMEISCLLLVFTVFMALAAMRLPLVGMVDTVGYNQMAFTLVKLGIQGTLAGLLQLLIGIVIINAIFSWIQSYSPLRQPLQRLAEPVLSPIRRFLPPIANIDLSPLVAIILLQTLLLIVD